MKFFDLLFSRYSQPMNFLDNLIPYGLLCEFIDYFLEAVNEAQVWEFWLHKDIGMAWGDFKLEAIPQNINIKGIGRSAEIIEKKLMEGGCWLNGNI